MPSTERFWDRIARRYARTPIKDQAAYEHKLAMTQRYLDPSMTLLELGCGTGGTALLHAPHVRAILATDISENMVSIGRERAAEAGVDNVVFQRAALEDFNDDSDSYDMVLALNLLHLVKDLDDALRRIHGLTRPGGLFVSGTACLAAGFGWLRYVGPVGRAVGLLPTISLFSEDELIARMNAAGFAIEETWQADGRGHHVLFVIARRSS